MMWRTHCGANSKLDRTHKAGRWDRCANGKTWCDKNHDNSNTVPTMG